MRFAPQIFQKVESRNLQSNTRLTVLPLWSLKKTPPVYGSSIKGPFRYYTDGNDVEYEIPSPRNWTINRDKSQDVASCNITIYNTWHESNNVAAELYQQLGIVSPFWPKRGASNTSATWDQTPFKGAYRKDGVWDANFSWENTIVEDVLIKTYEGYGGNPTDNNYVSIQKNINDGNILQTGVWRVDTVSVSSDGNLVLSCRDIGSILLDQKVFPPVIPPALYPLEYYPDGKSAFDSFFGPRVKPINSPGSKISPGEKGEVWIWGSSHSGSFDPSVSSKYPLSNSRDGDPRDFTLSEAYEHPHNGDSVTFEYGVGQGISSIAIRPWAGGYTCYVSVRKGGVWLGDENIPDSNPSKGIKYLAKSFVPMAIPDGKETMFELDLGDGTTTTNGVIYDIERIRITFQNLYYSGIPDSNGYQYRAGIREINAYRLGRKTDNYNPNFDTTPWTFAMTSHPTRGYWVVEKDGTVHGFGDASFYDSSTFGVIPLPNTGIDNRAHGITPHPDGQGYWVVDWMGRVYAHGSATHYGQHLIPDPWVSTWGTQKKQAVGIAATYTGNGYWVAYSDGNIRGFGDANPTNVTIPDTALTNFMEIWQNAMLKPNTHPYKLLLKCTAIASHPKKMGFYATDGSGQVFAYGSGVKSYGQLHQRVYKSGAATSFKLQPKEWATAIETTVNGDGYWIAFGSGKIAAFGEADKGGPVDIYSTVNEGMLENVIVEPESFDRMGFRDIVWGLSRDPDGGGFYVLNASGKVFNYEAEFWGRPGYQGMTGYRWHEGNFNGEYADIVRDLVRWGGFTFYDPNITSSEEPGVLGVIESTGIRTDTTITGETFDKKSLFDCIKELAEVVTYRAYITEEGGFAFHDNNMWRAGNYDENRVPIYVKSGTLERVDSSDPEAEPFIPVIHEETNLLSYTATLSNADKRSEIIVGTQTPNPKDPTQTSFVRHIPPDAKEMIRPGIPSNRGIERPAIWTSHVFDNEEERKLMAELIGIHAWFGKRTGTTTTVGNPALSLDDQIRIVERSTGETFIHLVSSISTNVDCDSGAYTMSINHHWLGDADNWALTTGSESGNYPYVRISERLDSWQAFTGRGLLTGNAGNGTVNNIIELYGNFSTSTSVVLQPWKFEGTFDLNTFIPNLRFRTDVISPPLGVDAIVKVWDESDVLLVNQSIPDSLDSIVLGNLGVINQNKTYRYEISGVAASTGSAELKFSLRSSHTLDVSISDTILITNNTELGE